MRACVLEGGGEGWGELGRMWGFFYKRHVNVIPRKGHQALPKSRRDRIREGKGEGEGITISEDIHRKRVANSVTIFKGSFLGPREKERSPKKENKGL